MRSLPPPFTKNVALLLSNSLFHQQADLYISFLLLLKHDNKRSNIIEKDKTSPKIHKLIFQIEILLRQVLRRMISKSFLSNQKMTLVPNVGEYVNTSWRYMIIYIINHMNPLIYHENEINTYINIFN